MKQSEFDSHVAYVAEELIRFYNHSIDSGLTERGQKVWSKIYARDIVQRVTSKPVPWWKRIFGGTI
jgi:hypothetical protein